jgi:hypothetical protein
MLKTEDEEMIAVPGPIPLERQNAIHEVRYCLTCPAELAVDAFAWAKQCHDCFRDERTKRMCALCKKPRIPCTEPEWKVVCGTCFKDAAMRPCSKCKEYKIKSFDPAWRTMCQQCYQSKEWDRPCTECNERPVKDGLPSYITKCTRCYLKQKNETHESCPTCVGERPRWERKGSPSCRECMIGNGLIKIREEPCAV